MAAEATIAPYDGTTDSANIQLLPRGTIFPDVITNGESVATGEALEIQCEGNDDIIIFMQGSAASVVTLEAGDYPPSPQAGLGSKAYTVPSGDQVPLIPEAGRHIKQTIGGDVTMAGSIVAQVTGTGPVLFWVFRAPGGFAGSVITNTATIPAAPTS